MTNAWCGNRAEVLSAHERARLRRALLQWYEVNKRDLPWRKTSDPYRIWISEIMLQQTRVAAVLPRYKKFLQRFPSVQKLAAARESSVLAEWSGLGYYRRARNLHAAAKIIVAELSGKFPETAQGWKALPGIGRYTAAAIASIALGEPVAVLDGNVERIIRRLSCVEDQAGAWITAEALLDRARPGDFNQAMMELGALVCLPGEPTCGACPIRKFCRTMGSGESGRTAQPREKKEIAYAIARSEDSVRLVRRPQGASLMPGMWELPESDTHRKDALFTVRHSITVTDYSVKVVAARDDRPEAGTWVRISRLNKMPLTGLTKKILRRAEII